MDKRIITATGTTIGLSLGQEAGAPIVTTVFGYKRAEFASVPIPNKDNNTLNTVPDVLTELYYSRNNDSHLYQRMAVGYAATSSAGAAIIFAKNSKGEIDGKASMVLSKYSASLDSYYAAYIKFLMPNGITNLNNQKIIAACFEEHGLKVTPTNSELALINAQNIKDKKAEVTVDRQENKNIFNLLVNDHFKTIRALCANQIGLLPQEIVNKESKQQGKL